LSKKKFILGLNQNNFENNENHPLVQSNIFGLVQSIFWKKILGPRRKTGYKALERFLGKI